MPFLKQPSISSNWDSWERRGGRKECKDFNFAQAETLQWGLWVNHLFQKRLDTQILPTTGFGRKGIRIIKFSWVGNWYYPASNPSLLRDKIPTGPMALPNSDRVILALDSRWLDIWSWVSFNWAILLMTRMDWPIKRLHLRSLHIRVICSHLFGFLLWPRSKHVKGAVNLPLLDSEPLP